MEATRRLGKIFDMSGKSESRGIPSRIPLIGALTVLIVAAASIGLVLRLCLSQTAGEFTYALDDPYIHLAIAKNLAAHGVWGVTPYSASSASSSPLWTTLLATAIRLTGNSLLWPFAFGVLASISATLFANAQFVRIGLNPVVAAVASLVLFAIGPLFMLPFTGMEHSLQILLDLVFGFWLLDLFGRDSSTRDAWVAGSVTALMCSCRYESVFLLVVPFFAALLRRDSRIAVGLAIGPLVAVGGFGLYSHLVGMPLVPNSIMTKGNIPHASPGAFAIAIAGRIFWTVYLQAQELGCLVLAAAGLVFALRAPSLRKTTAGLRTYLWTVIVAAVLHAGFAMMGIFYRYEGYLLVLLVTGIVLAVHAISKVLIHSLDIRGKQLFSGALFESWILMICTPSLIALACYGRASDAFRDVRRGSRDIYLQQIQMARFVARYYPKGRVAANDIGAISYFSDIHLLDLVGLATDDIARARVAQKFDTATIAREIGKLQPEAIMAYPEWFRGWVALPDSLVPVCDWTIPPVTSAASRLVRFYATSEESAKHLRQNLIEFQPQLPSEVRVDYPGLGRVRRR